MDIGASNAPKNIGNLKSTVNGKLIAFRKKKMIPIVNPNRILFVILFDLFSIKANGSIINISMSVKIGNKII